VGNPDKTGDFFKKSSRQKLHSTKIFSNSNIVATKKTKNDNPDKVFRKIALGMGENPDRIHAN